MNKWSPWRSQDQLTGGRRSSRITNDEVAQMLTNRTGANMPQSRTTASPPETADPDNSSSNTRLKILQRNLRPFRQSLPATDTPQNNDAPSW
jgi:hypothetical protein